MQHPDVSLTGSLSVGKMASSNSARYRLARSGEKSRRHSSAEGLPVSETFGNREPSSSLLHTGDLLRAGGGDATESRGLPNFHAVECTGNYDF